MRQLTKEVYEAPLTTKRVVTMESSCMAASGESTSKDTQVQFETTEHEAGNSFTITGEWE